MFLALENHTSKTHFILNKCLLAVTRPRQLSLFTELVTGHLHFQEKPLHRSYYPYHLIPRPLLVNLNN